MLIRADHIIDVVKARPAMRCSDCGHGVGVAKKSGRCVYCRARHEGKPAARPRERRNAA